VRVRPRARASTGARVARGSAEGPKRGDAARHHAPSGDVPGGRHVLLRRGFQRHLTRRANHGGVLREMLDQLLARLDVVPLSMILEHDSPSCDASAVAPGALTVEERVTLALSRRSLSPHARLGPTGRADLWGDIRRGLGVEASRERGVEESATSQLEVWGTRACARASSMGSFSVTTAITAVAASEPTASTTSEHA